MKCRNITKSIILPAAVATMAALLLEGCQEGNCKGHSSQKKNEIQTTASIDTSTLEESFMNKLQNLKFFIPIVC